VSREAQARICERLGVKFPGPTRQSSWIADFVGYISDRSVQLFIGHYTSITVLKKNKLL
jgi:hypothetical protein